MSHTLILTNSTYPDSEFKAKIKILGFDFVHAPALSVSYRDINLSSTFVPSVLIVTSKHAVYGIDNHDISRNIDVVCVGEVLKKQLLSLGFVNVRNCFESGDDLLSDIKEHSDSYERSLYLRGKDVQHDIKSVCSAQNILFEEFVVYESIANLDSVAKHSGLLMSDQDVTICVFSRKGADSIAEGICNADLVDVVKRTNILCLSESMISSLEQFQWRNISCCTSPTRDEFLRELSVIK